jgi:hypothetical protein
MKYYLHDSNSFNDEKITELFIKFGYEGLGLFYTCLEKFAQQEKHKIKPYICLMKNKKLFLIQFYTNKTDFEELKDRVDILTKKLESFKDNYGTKN